MILLMNGGNTLCLHMRIDFSGVDAGVAQENLDAAQIRSALEQVCRKGMSEGMGGNGTLNVCEKRIFFNELPDVLPGQAGSGAI